MHGKDLTIYKLPYFSYKTSVFINSSAFVPFLDDSYGPGVMTEHLDIGRTLSTLWSSWILQHIQLCELITADYKMQKIG